MKKICYLFFSCIIHCCIIAQPLPDSIKLKFNKAKTDSEKGKILIRYFDWDIIDDDSFLKNLAALRQYFEVKKDLVAEDYVRIGMTRKMSRVGEYVESLDELFQLLPRFEQRKDEYGIMTINMHFSYAYYAAGDKEKTLYYDKQAVDLSRLLGDKYELAWAFNNFGSDLSEYGFGDSSFEYTKAALRLAREMNEPLLLCTTLGSLAETYIAQKKYDTAIYYLRECLPIALVFSKADAGFALNDFSEIFLAKHQNDSAIYYANRAGELCKKINLASQLLRAYQYLYTIYASTGPLDSAYKYLGFIVSTKDSIFSLDKAKQVEVINMRELNHKQEIEQEKEAFQNKINCTHFL